ncbi:hypothetical protein ACJMK2_035094 [Sinanodonta woodiana]|uniref:S-methyl-5-thioribose kinase n=1 Tax=Sinanodonta woodiana TaxID=1069815 RepID=A0ABD3WVI4_SINWO
MAQVDNVDTLIKTLKCHAGIEELSFLNDPVEVEETGDGNLNNVYRVWKKDEFGQISKSVIVKQGLPYIKCLGEDYPLGVDRIGIEYKALRKFHEYSPGSVPAVYFYDRNSSIVCMEDLLGYEVLRKRLIQRKFDLDLAKTISTHIAFVHRKSHIGSIGEEKLKELDAEFENSNMVSLTEQYIFTRPFTRGDPTNRCSEGVQGRLDMVYNDQDVMTAVQNFKKLFLEKKEALVHGDLHTGSLMVKGADVRMIDVEFAYVGPCAFDIGLLLANYIFSYYHHMSIPEDHDERRKFAQLMIDACHTTVQTYLSNMTSFVGDRETYEKNLLSEIAGFTGCEIIRRIIGTAHVEDLENVRYAEEDALGAGIRLLNAYERIHTIDMLMVIALMLIF